MRFILVRGIALGLMLGCAAGGGADAAPGAAVSDTSHVSDGDVAQVAERARPTPVASSAVGGGSTLFADEGSAQAMPVAHAACTKIDLLYVVDNSPSMSTKQMNLARSFQGFSRILENVLGSVDRQIMVVDTDAYDPAGHYHPYDDSSESESEAEAGCSALIGAGLRMSPKGESCGVMGEQRFLLDDQPHLASTFGCLAMVGTHGGVQERPIQALLAALGAGDGQAAECNQGFPRDDALLIVTLITDEDDISSEGDPEDWKRLLVGLRQGRERSVVMLGLLSDDQRLGVLPVQRCAEADGEPSARLERFVSSFEHGSLGSVCAPDYSTFFPDAVGSIDTACQAFEPILH